MNMQQMLKQAQKMQQKFQQAQEELKDKEFTGSSGGGVVEATVNGQGQVLDLSIDPEVVDPEDVGMLQDMILTAIQNATEEADQAREDAMPEMGLPGGGDMGGLGDLLG